MKREDFLKLIGDDKVTNRDGRLAIDLDYILSKFDLEIMRQCVRENGEWACSTPLGVRLKWDSTTFTALIAKHLRIPISRNTSTRTTRESISMAKHTHRILSSAILLTGFVNTMMNRFCFLFNNPPTRKIRNQRSGGVPTRKRLEGRSENLCRHVYSTRYGNRDDPFAP